MALWVLIFFNIPLVYFFSVFLPQGGGQDAYIPSDPSLAYTVSIYHQISGSTDLVFVTEQTNQCCQDAFIVCKITKDANGHVTLGSYATLDPNN